MEGQIIWIDCADEEQVPKDKKNDLVLDFPAPVSNSPGPSINSRNPSLTAIGGVPALGVGGGTGPGVGQPIKRQAKNSQSNDSFISLCKRVFIENPELGSEPGPKDKLKTSSLTNSRFKKRKHEPEEHSMQDQNKERPESHLTLSQKDKKPYTLRDVIMGKI